MNDTDRIHKENKLEQDITLPYLKSSYFSLLVSLV